MKKAVLFILAVFACSSVFAEKWNVYAGADEKTLEIIKTCDEQIEKKQYQSAAYTVGGCENEYIIYKYIEVCTQYFAQSIMHSMFAFKNLEKGETLYDVRTGEGSFNMTFRDEPDTIIDNYKKNHGNSMVLELARANYYFDALMRYGNQWLKTPEEVLTLTKDVYSRAIELEVYDEWTVQNYASLMFNEENWPKAEMLYKMLADKYSTNGNYWYNLTVAKMYQDKYAEAIESAKKAVENPEENPEYHLDAYLILSDAYAFSGDFKSAEKTLNDSLKKFKNQPIVYQRLGELYISFEDNVNYNKANTYFDKAVKTVCDETVIYNCVKLYMMYGTPQMAIDFCTRNMKKHKDKNKPGLFNFFLAQVYAYTGKMEEANKYIDEAEKTFKKLNDEQWLDNCSQLRAEINSAM
ncbi:MAG: tetratricopeptide repeat protein [Treponema sp.]|nr:tetratricopeptide repeat protein [Treponema sp.]